MALGMYLNRHLSSVWQLYVFYGLLMGMGKAAFHSPLMSYIARIFDKRRGLAVGLIFSGTGIGLFVLAPLTRYLISTVGWRMTFVSLALSLVVGRSARPLVFPRKTGAGGRALTRRACSHCVG